MDEEWGFCFRSFRQPHQLEVTSVGRIERDLLADLKNPAENKQAVRARLIQLYRYSDRIDDAIGYTIDYLREGSSLSESGWAWVKLGQIMEQIDDFSRAVECYRMALPAEEAHLEVRYCAHNNLGYSLNQLGRYVEAEQHCSLAIELIPGFFNAHKNLGVSMEGQGQFEDAARSYISSVRLNAADPRALTHLEELLIRHLELYEVMPVLSDDLHNCRRAVLYAEVHNEHRQ